MVIIQTTRAYAHWAQLQGGKHYGEDEAWAQKASLSAREKGKQPEQPEQPANMIDDFEFVLLFSGTVALSAMDVLSSCALVGRPALLDQYLTSTWALASSHKKHCLIVHCLLSSEAHMHLQHGRQQFGSNDCNKESIHELEGEIQIGRFRPERCYSHPAVSEVLW